jgi:hypothetical protein
MTKPQPAEEAPSSYVFQVEIMIEDGQHGIALEKLIRGLNAGGYADYRITSGIKLGEKMQERATGSFPATPVPVVHEPVNQSDEQTASDKAACEDAFAQIRSFMKSNKLIRLIVNRGFGIKLSIPCRIINMDESEQIITVYHVDEKQVYTFRMTEIEDFLE